MTFSTAMYQRMPTTAFRHCAARRTSQSPNTGFTRRSSAPWASLKSGALANRDTGQLERRTADATVREEVIGGKLDDHFIVDPIQRGAGTSINMNVNEVMSMRGPRAPE